MAFRLVSFVRSILERVLGARKGVASTGSLFCIQNMNSRIKRLEFHIKNNDYFGTLATVLDLVRQSKNNKALKNIKNDLIYLQNNYCINKKIK